MTRSISHILGEHKDRLVRDMGMFLANDKSFSHRKISFDNEVAPKDISYLAQDLHVNGAVDLTIAADVSRANEVHEKIPLIKTRVKGPMLYVEMLQDETIDGKPVTFQRNLEQPYTYANLRNQLVRSLHDLMQTEYADGKKLFRKKFKRK